MKKGAITAPFFIGVRESIIVSGALSGIPKSLAFPNIRNAHYFFEPFERKKAAGESSRENR
jgi:hypothetical protein